MSSFCHPVYMCTKFCCWEICFKLAIPRFPPVFCDHRKIQALDAVLMIYLTLRPVFTFAHHFAPKIMWKELFFAHLHSRMLTCKHKECWSRSSPWEILKRFFQLQHFYQWKHWWWIKSLKFRTCQKCLHSFSRWKKNQGNTSRALLSSISKFEKKY